MSDYVWFRGDQLSGRQGGGLPPMAHSVGADPARWGGGRAEPAGLREETCQPAAAPSLSPRLLEEAPRPLLSIPKDGKLEPEPGGPERQRLVSCFLPPSPLALPSPGDLWLLGTVSLSIPLPFSQPREPRGSSAEHLVLSCPSAGLIRKFHLTETGLQPFPFFLHFSQK